MTCHDPHHGRRDPGPSGAGGSAEWDERYSASEQVWSGNPNRAVVDEVAALEVGRALDVGCGEGADAIWLAARGWTVTGADISAVALERAKRAAEAVGVDVDWVAADMRADPPAPGAYDLVSIQYPSFGLEEGGNGVVDALLAAVAVGGTILVVGHVLTDEGRAQAAEHGFDPARYVGPADFAARMGESWRVDVDEVRPGRHQTPSGIALAGDHVLRAHRLG